MDEETRKKIHELDKRMAEVLDLVVELSKITIIMARRIGEETPDCLGEGSLCREHYKLWHRKV